MFNYSQKQFDEMVEKLATVPDEPTGTLSEQQKRILDYARANPLISSFFADAVAEIEAARVIQANKDGAGKATVEALRATTTVLKAALVLGLELGMALRDLPPEGYTEPDDSATSKHLRAKMLEMLEVLLARGENVPAESSPESTATSSTPCDCPACRRGEGPSEETVAAIRKAAAKDLGIPEDQIQVDVIAVNAPAKDGSVMPVQRRGEA